jgi:hypothetical protein
LQIQLPYDKIKKEEKNHENLSLAIGQFGMAYFRVWFTVGASYRSGEDCTLILLVLTG